MAARDTEPAVKVGDTVSAAGQPWTVTEVEGHVLTVRDADGAVRTALLDQIDAEHGNEG